MVGRLGAVPAYPDTTPELAVGLRRTGSRVGDVARALDAGEVFKTYAFRGATHLLTPEEGGAYLALRASGRQWELPSWQETYGLTPADWPAFRETVREAVADGPLTRQELSDGGRSPAPVPGRRSRPDQRLGHPAEVADVAGRPVLRAGPRRRGDRPEPAAGRALGRAAGRRRGGPQGRRGVRPHLRPDDRRSVQYYLGEGLSAGRKALRGWLDDLSDRLVTVDVDGEDLLVSADDADDLTSTTVSPTVRLLPAADPWVMGPGTADPHVVPPAHRQLVTRGANLVARRRRRGRHLDAQGGHPHRRLVRRGRPTRSRPARAEAARLAAVLGTELDLDVTAG